MGQRLLLALVTGLGLSGVYLAYALTVAPVFQIPHRTPGPLLMSDSPATQRPQENLRLAETWLPDLPWVSEAKYLLRTKEMFVYANTWEPEGEKGQIRFRPFAAIGLRTNEKGEQQAVTVNAESALLVFQSAYELSSPNPGHVTRGALDGDVRITGSDGLEIRGENFIFSEGLQSIASYSSPHHPNPVQFRFGPNRGQAQSVRLDLIKSEMPVAKDRPNVVGVRSVTLSNNVRMELMPSQQQNQEQVPIHVRCTDQFVYQVESRTATFDANVVAFRKTGLAKKSDQLFCDRLTVHFEPKAGIIDEPQPAPAQVAAKKPEDVYQKIDRDLEFRSLKAEVFRDPKSTGKPRSVFIKSEEQGLEAWMTTLTYDARERTIRMFDESGIQIQQRENWLRVPEIEVVLHEDFSLKDAVCRGPGWLVSHRESGEVAYQADWMHQMRKTTDPESQLDLIELEKDALFQQPAQQSDQLTALGADVIRIWFEPPPKSEEKTSEIRLMDPGAVEPKRLLALQQVAFISPRVEYEGQQLEVVFAEDAAATEKEVTPLGRRNRPTRWSLTSKRSPSPTDQSARRVTGMASVPPEQAKQSVSKQAKSDPEQDASLDSTLPEQPMAVLAEKMWVRVRPVSQPDQQPDVAEIWTIGQVHIEQPMESRGAPVVVEGSRVHVENHAVKNQNPSDQVIHIFGEPGRPAHLKDEQQQLYIEGQTIHFDRAANLAWVDGAGLLQLPVPATLDGKPLEVPQMLDIWWKNEMDFDGLLATFDGDVRAKMDASSMQCRTMQVELSDRISFTGTVDPSVKPQVQSVTCRFGVEFENVRTENGQLLEIQKANVDEFHLNNLTQETEAQGPGWMQMWRRGKGTRAGLSETSTVEANHATNERAAEWEYTRVDFADHMQGHIGRRRTSFRDRVEVVYGSVLRPVDTIDPNHLSKDSGSMRCDSLHIDQTSPNEEGKTFVQLWAEGNTRMEGRGFNARADEITYDETKGLFVLRSFGRYKANLWREHAADGQNQTEAQRMEFYPATNQVKVIQSRGGIRGN